LAAVRRDVAPGAVGSAWEPALGKVWEFIRSQLGVAREPHTAEKEQILQQPAGKLAVALAAGAIGPGRGDW